jgi:hypothetical protein
MTLENDHALLDVTTAHCSTEPEALKPPPQRYTPKHQQPRCS